MSCMNNTDSLAIPYRLFVAVQEGMEEGGACSFEDACGLGVTVQ